MSGESDKPDETFLSRWARRKAAVRAEEQTAASASVQAPEEEEEAVDPATLPPIESLTAESDFSVFMKKGVPAALRMAALRKLWLTEPSVVNYKPLVDYDWDFNAPGYGELLPTDDIEKFARTVFEGTRREDAPQENAVPADPSSEPPQIAAAPPAEEPLNDHGIAAGADQTVQPAEQVSVHSSFPPRRRHGGALPS